MEFADFTSPAYRLETPNAASGRMVNLYCEKVERGPRAGKLRIRQIPGMKAFCTLPDSPVRGLLRIDSGNRLFAIAGGTVYEVFSDGTYSALTGSVGISSHPALMVTNGFQIAIASGGQAYLAEGQSGGPGTVTPITFTDGTPLRAATIDFLGQFFIANQIDSKQVYVSGIAPDGGTWDPADTAIKEGYSDNISRVFADNGVLWLFGFDTTEVWSQTGNAFPFQRIQSAVLKIGCSAPYSVAGAQGKRFWLWQGAIYGAYGIDPQRVSDFGVETAIESYGDTSDAEAWCQLSGGGHLFYVIGFPRANRCWVYDDSLKAWHERDYFSAGQYSRYRGRVYASAFNKDLVGDIESGAIYELDDNTFTDAGGIALRRELVTPYLTSELRNVRYSRLEIDCDTGVGLSVPETSLGYDPQLTLRYSNDRGKKWSYERQASLGKVGDDQRRVVFNQLGSSRIGMTFELTCTDPIRLMFNTAFLKLGGALPGTIEAQRS